MRALFPTGAARVIFAVALALGTLASGPPARAAGIKEYQARRLLMLKTECTVSAVRVDEVEGGENRFTATCENVSHYPDGVEIVCPDTEDDRDCRILTARREFPHLRALER